MPRLTSDSGRHTRPTDRDWLHQWIVNQTGVRLARNSVCEGHVAPFDVLADWQFKRPPQSLTLGPRGGGKSFMTAIDTHLCSRFERMHGTRILGGAKSQALQIIAGFKRAVLGTPEKDQLARAGVERIDYRNGSEIAILTASPTSVRGPHVPSLRMDEVDEIEPQLMEDAIGMVMDLAEGRGYAPMMSKTSTWHNLGGPMASEIEKSKEEDEKRPGSYPFYTFCLFDIIQRCPEEISGPNLEYCPACPLMRYCHEDKERFGGVPKAKRANGHYTIKSAIQKIAAASHRTFESDYLCRGVKVEGLYFPDFSAERNVSEKAEYDPSLPVHFSLDTGLRTAGVWFQVKKTWAGYDFDVEVNVFADYFAEHLTPAEHLHGQPGGDGRKPSEGIRAIAERRCEVRMEHRWTDPAGRARNNVGTIVLGEYENAGMSFTCWPLLAVRDGLELVEVLIRGADGKVRLKVHPRCTHLIRAFSTYRRAKRAGQYMDEPEDPCHPQEDLMDALRGGLVGNFPEGRKPQPKLTRMQASRIF